MYINKHAINYYEVSALLSVLSDTYIELINMDWLQFVLHYLENSYDMTNNIMLLLFYLH